jgi:hypothetical protein
MAQPAALEPLGLGLPSVRALRLIRRLCRVARTTGRRRRRRMRSEQRGCPWGRGGYTPERSTARDMWSDWCAGAGAAGSAGHWLFAAVGRPLSARASRPPRIRRHARAIRTRAATPELCVTACSRPTPASPRCCPWVRPAPVSSTSVWSLYPISRHFVW